MIREVGEILIRRGRRAAREWLQTASPSDVARLTQFPFEFGHTALDDLRSAGFTVPKSPDLHFSWGFWQQVNWHVDGGESPDPPLLDRN